MYKKIMVFGMVLLIILFNPLPSFSTSVNGGNPYKWKIPSPTNVFYKDGTNYSPSNYKPFETNYYYVVSKKQNGINYYYMYISSSPLIYEYDSLAYLKVINSGYVHYQLQKINNDDNWKLLASNLNNVSASLEAQTILYASTNIYDINGVPYFLVDNSNVQEFDGRITLPGTDGYKDNGTTFSFWQWYQLPTGIDSTDIEINPYVDDLKTTYFSPSITLHQKIPNTNKWNLNLNLTVYEYGQHTYKIVFKQKSSGKILGTLTRTFEALEGFIDENGDGLDDRTNQPPYTPLEPPNGDVNSPEWDGTILGFFTFLINSIKYYVQAIVSGINVTISTIGQVPTIMGTILNFPPELTSLLILGVTCTIILAIFRR